MSMELGEELKMSYYVDVADISEEHGVRLCQHAETGDFFVKKMLTVCNRDVLRRLKLDPVKGMPQIHEMFVTNDGVCIIEEYIPGKTLERILSEKKRLSVEEASDYLFQLCKITERLHSMTPAIIHRDIKPSNIIVTPDGIVKLLDVNAARFVSEHDAEDTVIMGTAGYAAPEQFGFTATGPAADIYALGVVLNRMLTGELPKTRLPEDKQLRSIVERCTKMEPKERFSSVGEIAAKLKAAPCRKKESEERLRFLPPGFRNRSILRHLVSTALYVMLGDLCLTMNVKDVTPLGLAVQRIGFLLILLADIFFAGNYLGVQDYCPFTRSENRMRRILGIVLTMALITFSGIIILVILTS